MTHADDAARWAITQNDATALRDAIAQGARPDALLDGRLVSLVGYAAQSGTAAMVTLLLDAGGSAARIAGATRSPLELAIGSRDGKKKARRLLDAGATPTEGIPLLRATDLSEHDAVAMTTLLLERGAPVDQRDEETGWTALHYAVCRENVPLVQLLLSHGARTDLSVHLDPEEFGIAPEMTAPQIARQYAKDTRRTVIGDLLSPLGVIASWKLIDKAAASAAFDREGVLDAATRVARTLGDEDALAILTSAEFAALREEVLTAPRIPWPSLLALGEIARLLGNPPSAPLDEATLVGTWTLATYCFDEFHGSETPASGGEDPIAGELSFRADGSLLGDISDEPFEGRWTLNEDLTLQLDTHEAESVEVRYNPELKRLYLVIDDGETAVRSYGLERVS